MGIGKYCNNYNNDKLLGRIIYKCGSRENFADELGISYTSVVNKLLGRSGWKMNEIEDSLKILDIQRNEIGDYFFNLD